MVKIFQAYVELLCCLIFNLKVLIHVVCIFFYKL